MQSQQRAPLSPPHEHLAAKLDLANECPVGLTRKICKITHRLRPLASFAHVLATQQLFEGALLETPNLSSNPTPVTKAARAKFKYLGLGACAFGIMTRIFASEQGTEQLSTLGDLYGLEYFGMVRPNLSSRLKHLPELLETKCFHFRRNWLPGRSRISTPLPQTSSGCKSLYFALLKLRATIRISLRLRK